MSGVEWVAVLIGALLAAIAAGIKLMCDKLDSIISLLEIANRRND